MADNETLPATRDDGALEIKADGLAPIQFTMEKITDALPPAVFDHIGRMIPFSPEQEKELDEPIDEQEIDIKPDGMIYASHEYYRRKLNKVFGRGQWCVLPVSGLVPRNQTQGDYAKTEWYRDYFMFIQGIFFSRCMVSRILYDNNDNMDLSDVDESMGSDAIRRCCKNLGIAQECWNRRFQKEWRDKMATRVAVRRKRRGQEETVYMWRRKDADPLQGEMRTGSEDKKGQDTNSARATGDTPVKSEVTPPASTAPARAPSTQGPEKPNGTTAPSDEPPPVSSATERLATPASDQRKPMLGGLLPQQERAIWARARTAGLVVADDANGLLTLLTRGQYSTIVPIAGRTSAENCAALFKGIAGIKLAALLKQIDASKVAKPNQVETI